MKQNAFSTPDHRQLRKLRHGFQLLLTLLCLPALCGTCFGMAQEQAGPDAADRPTTSQPGWNPGIVELPRHPSRVYSIWVNGNESFYFQAGPQAMNELIDLFSKARLRDHEIWIKPGTNTLKTFGGTSVNYNACLTINSGIALAFRREQESGATLEPGLILYAGEAGPALNQLKFPENVIVHCEVPGADFKRNSAIPARHAWYGRIQSGDTNPAAMTANGLVTQVALWDDRSSEGIPLGNTSPDGHFKAVFSDEEFAALNKGDLWITVTTGNFMTAPRKEDQHFPVALLARERDGAAPLVLGRPPFYHGRILFEDGTAAVLNPIPWPGAEIFVDFPYVGTCRIDADGWFKLFLEPEQYAALKSRKPYKNIYIPTEQRGSSTARYEFPPGLLSLEKTNAGVVKIPKPEFSSASDTGSLDAERVLAIARAAVGTNDTWLDKAEFETPKRKADGTWSVMVWRLPKTPGGHRLITVDASGKVTDYMRGR